MLTFYEQIDLVKKGIITNDDAIKNLKISKSTYYRLKNKVSKQDDTLLTLITH